MPQPPTGDGTDGGPVSADGPGEPGRQDDATGPGSSSGSGGSDGSGRSDGPGAPGGAGATVGRRRRGVSLRAVSIVLVAVVGGASLFLSGFALGGRVATTPGTPAALEQEFSPFWDVYHLIQGSYAGEPRPTDQQLIEAAIKGMVGSLNDPYSYYQSPADFQAALQNVGGHDVGVGVFVQLQPTAGSSANCGGDATIGASCELGIIRPIPGSPAEKAGIKPGDIIAAVDGKSLDGLTVDKTTALIKGPQDTKVTLTIHRDGQSISVPIVRAMFDRPEVDTRTLANGSVEYIEVAGINDVARSQFHAALAAALDAGRRSFVIDLRDNGGGYVQSAVAMASDFLSSGVVVYQRDASGNEISTPPNAGGIATDPSIKVVVLVNGNTASAAEILAAALQGNGRAQLIGEKTFGKGVFQAWLELNGLGGVHLTVGQWLTPKHVSINKVGLKPDVPASSAGARAGTDPVIDAGLKALGYPAEPTPAESPAPSSSASPAPSASPSTAPAAS